MLGVKGADPESLHDRSRVIFPSALREITDFIDQLNGSQTDHYILVNGHRIKMTKEDAARLIAMIRNPGAATIR